MNRSFHFTIGFFTLVIMISALVIDRPAGAKIKRGAAVTALPTSEPEPNGSTITPPTTKPPSLHQRVLGGAISIVPGALFSGGGHWMIGETETAKKLFWTKIAGAAALFTGGAALASTGASSLVTPWGTPMLIVSGAAFAIPTLLDLVGSVSDQDKIGLTPAISTAPLLTGQGRLLIGLSGALRETSLTSTHPLTQVSFAQDLDGLAYRASGSWTDQQSRYQIQVEREIKRSRGWGLWARLGASAHVITSDDLSLTQGEASVVMPLRFGLLYGPTLSSMSGQLSVGWSGGSFNYGEQFSDALTGVLGGFTLTHHSDQDRTRFTVQYEHRHDDWVGGAIVPGLGSGVLGYVSVSLGRKLFDRLWANGKASFGSAHLYTLCLTYAVNPTKPKGESR